MDTAAASEQLEQRLSVLISLAEAQRDIGHSAAAAASLAQVRTSRAVTSAPVPHRLSFVVMLGTDGHQRTTPSPSLSYFLSLPPSLSPAS